MSESADDYAVAREAMRCRLSVLRNMEREDRGLPLTIAMMGVPFHEVTPEIAYAADHIRNQIILTLAEGTTFVATSEVCKLLEQTHSTYPTGQMFMSDILVPAGLVYFAEPISDPIPDASQLPIRAISWQVFPVADEEIDFFGRKEFTPTGTYAVTLIGYADSASLSHAVEHGLQHYPRICPVVSVIWEVDAPDGGGLVGVDIKTMVASQKRRTPYVKALMAYWAIVRQRLAVDQEVVVKEHAKELVAARRKRPVIETTKIIRMRPRKKSYVYTGDHGFNRPNWKNSWWVSSFWRQQWYPATQEHKPILILPFMKGPADKPALGADRVFLPPKPPKD